MKYYILIPPLILLLFYGIMRYDYTPSPEFSKGDCLIRNKTDPWQNLSILKIEEVGKYSYKLKDDYILFKNQDEYIKTECKNDSKN